MTDDVRISRSCVIPGREISFRFSRSGGPGGQNVNRRETQVELVFDVAGSPSLGPVQRARALRRLESRLDSDGKLHINASEGRTQGYNREAALERFQKLMADALKPPPPKRRPSKPSRAARERRLQDKRLRARRKRERRYEPDD
ncbi:MAG: alternative ribosome rescue aminoacyl-tRNA hydrolase ArfB [Actinomycetota bacterium]